MQAKNPKNTTDVLRDVPGILIRPNPRYAWEGNSQRYLVENVRMATINPCPLLLFLSGVRIGSADEVDVDFLVSPESLEGLEVYTTVAGLPMQFNVPGAACGVIAFWTRVGERN